MGPCGSICVGNLAPWLRETSSSSHQQGHYLSQVVKDANVEDEVLAGMFEKFGKITHLWTQDGAICCVQRVWTCGLVLWSEGNQIGPDHESAALSQTPNPTP